MMDTAIRKNSHVCVTYILYSKQLNFKSPIGCPETGDQPGLFQKYHPKHYGILCEEYLTGERL
jgi:hypothetical protein